MMAYGYDLSGIYLIDAGNASRKAYSYAVFLDSWGVLGNMAVTANGTRDVVVRTPEVGNNSIAGQYIVQKGDYLSKLAREWGIGWKDLAAINNISYPYTLYPGQVLITGIEDGSGTVSTPVPTDPPPTPRPTDPPAPTATPVPTSTPEPTPEPTPLPTDDPSSEEGGNKVEVEGGGTIDADAYIVQKGEHLMQIARKLQLSWTAIAELNGLVAPYALQPGQTLKLPGPEAGPPPPPLESGEVGGEGTYVVQAGDYLYIIARRIGVNWHQLADLNGIRAPYIVYPGQVIKLP
jgi:LysM repeat protein